MWALIIGGAALALVALLDDEKKRKYVRAHQREHIRQRDGGICRICGNRIYNLHALGNGADEHSRAR
jgi:hypothetical protein